MVVAAPPSPFTVGSHEVPSGTIMYRVLDARSGRKGNEANPGYGYRTRFAFFPTKPGPKDPGKNPPCMPPGECRAGVVPVLYAASGIEASVHETILHDVPREGGAILSADYMHQVAVRLQTRRDLRLAAFMDDVDRRLNVSIRDVTEVTVKSDPDQYGVTVDWAEAAYREGFDGCVWMTERFNSQKAYVLFGDRVAATDLKPLPEHARAFALPDDRAWLTDLCGPLKIEVRW